jgi:tetratricopeptide (TPR) repeat protein
VEEFVWTVRMWRARIHAARGDIELLTEDLKPIRDRLEAPLIEHQVQTYLFAAAKADKKEAREQAYEAAMGRLMTLLRIQGLGPELEREAQYLLGTCYLNLGILKGRSTYYPQAMNCFLYAERAGLSTPQLYENWGQAYERKGQLARAAEKYGRVYDLVPTPANCLRAADYHLKASPRSSEGLDLLRAGLQRFPDDPGLKSRYLEATKPSKSG